MRNYRTHRDSTNGAVCSVGTLFGTAPNRSSADSLLSRQNKYRLSVFDPPTTHPSASPLGALYSWLSRQLTGPARRPNAPGHHYPPTVRHFTFCTAITMELQDRPREKEKSGGIEVAGFARNK